MKVVIVGGVAGGASAAARIRRLDEHAQIIMIERSGYVSYANCGLLYYVGGVIEEQEELTLQTPESFWDRFRIMCIYHSPHLGRRTLRRRVCDRQAGGSRSRRHQKPPEGQRIVVHHPRPSPGHHRESRV